MPTPVRRVRPNTVFEVSRRVVGGRFKLQANPRIIHSFLFLLAIYSNHYNIKLIAAVVMLNHYHLLGLDEEGRLPHFMQTFDALMARILNCIHGTEGTVWCANGYTPLEPMSDEASINRLDYLIENPLAADLVKYLKDYPHIRVREDDILREIEIERPDFFFSPRTKLPKKVTLRFHKLPALSHLSDEEYCKHIAERIKAAERRHIERRKRTGDTVMGCKRILKVRREDRPRKNRTWFKLRPQIAERNKRLRVAAIAALKEFRQRYREALAAWHAGQRDVLFPYGTWKMRIAFGVRVEPPPL